MRYVALNQFIDPRRYLLHLPMFAGSLPSQARAFAEDPAHYDFASRRCVKDLSVRRVTWTDSQATRADPSAEAIGLEILLGADQDKHDEDLLLRYSGVTEAHIQLSDRPPPSSHRLGFLILDELLPIPEGCLHEFAFWGGTVMVHAADVEATWVRPTP